MIQNQTLYVPTRSRMRALIPGASVAVLVALILGMGPIWLVSDGTLKTMGAVVMLLVPLCLVLAVAKARGLSSTQTSFALGLLIWWFLLISDKFFDRISDVQNTFEGQYSVDAYGEVFVWMVAFIVLAVISVAKPDYLGKFFSGSFKWLTLFVLSCLAASTYSPSPAYSMGWGFKLFVVALVLGLCTSYMERLRDVRAMFWSTMWGLLFVCLLAVAEAVSDPTNMFQGIGGRFNADPVVLSGTAGLLLICALTLNSLHSRLWLKLIALLSVLIMIISFGKTGIIAGVIGATIFLLFQKKLASSLGLLAGVALVAAILLATVTPLANYASTYHGGTNLTGRTEIWKAGIESIKQRPLLGHGYLATKFMWTTQRGGAVPDVAHLHNGFLEALYNNGLVGLFILLAIHGTILANLFYAKRTVHKYQRAGGSAEANTLIVGCFALYLDLLIYGLFTPAFGGRTTVHFMVFLSLLGLSMALRKCAEKVDDKAQTVARPSAPWREPISVPSPTA
jgi:O-antigen ligase